MKTLIYDSIVIEGVNVSDYPDFVDAFAVYAEWSDGSPLTEQELTDLEPELVQTLALETLI